MICNILWDVDGTLIETRPAIIHALSRSLTELGIAVAMNEIDVLLRHDVPHTIATLSERFRLDRHSLDLRFCEVYQKIPLERQPPFADVRKVCALIGQRGINVATTDRDPDSTWQLLSVHGLSTYFTEVISRGQHHTSKADPALFHAALTRHRLHQEETLAIGDQEIDIEAAHAVGLQTCLFGPAVVSAAADYHIHSYAQLLEILWAD